MPDTEKRHSVKAVLRVVRAFQAPGARLRLKHIMDVGSITESTAREYVATLRTMKLVHVAAWERSPNAANIWLMVYAWGNRPDAKRPAKMTDAERTARWRTRRDALDTVMRSLAGGTPPATTEPACPTTSTPATPATSDC